jgi:hypothetical protein
MSFSHHPVRHTTKTDHHTALPTHPAASRGRTFSRRAPDTSTLPRLTPAPRSDTTKTKTLLSRTVKPHAPSRDTPRPLAPGSSVRAKRFLSAAVSTPPPKAPLTLPDLLLVPPPPPIPLPSSLIRTITLAQFETLDCDCQKVVTKYSEQIKAMLNSYTIPWTMLANIDFANLTFLCQNHEVAISYMRSNRLVAKYRLGEMLAHFHAFIHLSTENSIPASDILHIHKDYNFLLILGHYVEIGDILKQNIRFHYLISLDPLTLQRILFRSDNILEILIRRGKDIMPTIVLKMQRAQSLVGL